MYSDPGTGTRLQILLRPVYSLALASAAVPWLAAGAATGCGVAAIVFAVIFFLAPRFGRLLLLAFGFVMLALLGLEWVTRGSVDNRMSPLLLGNVPLEGILWALPIVGVLGIGAGFLAPPED